MSTSPKQSYVVLGVQMEFLVSPEATSNNVAVLHSQLAPGLVIPLHSHADSEIFYILSGSLEAYEAGKGWKHYNAGEAIAVTGGVQHALRNTSDKSALAVAVTGKSLYEFFLEMAVPVETAHLGAPPSPEELQKLFAVAQKYGYWLGSPQDNEGIGIHLR